MSEVGYPSENLLLLLVQVPYSVLSLSSLLFSLLTLSSSFPPHVVTSLLPSSFQNSMNTTHSIATPSTKPQNSNHAQKLEKPHTHHLGSWVEKRITNTHDYSSGRMSLESQVRNVNAFKVIFISNYTIYIYFLKVKLFYKACNKNSNLLSHTNPQFPNLQGQLLSTLVADPSNNPFIFLN